MEAKKGIVADSARILSDFASGLCLDQIPAEVADTTKMFIADFYAACFAGIKVNAVFNEAILRIVEGMGGKEEASVLCAAHRFPAEHAAFMNAVYAHGADMDDGNRKAMGHVAAHVMSAVFALAEVLDDICWGDVITAINVGYEVYNRVAAAAQPGLVHRGFHSTGTAGAVACGAACAKLMGQNSDGIYNAMAIAALQSSGLIIVAESGQACKPLNPANAAKTGIVSAKLAASGIRGPAYPLESPKGWFHAMSDEIDTAAVTEGLGKVFTICESYLKPYPSCRHTHCGIDAAIRIREELLRDGVQNADIKALRLYIYQNAIQIAGKIRVPLTSDEAKFSIHYSLAVAILTGNYTLEDLSKTPEPAVRNLVEKIRLIPEAAMEDTASGIRGARLEAELENGKIYEAAVLLPKGDAANPFSWEDMKRKMAACMKETGFGYQADGILRRIREIDPQESYSNICRLLG